MFLFCSKEVEAVLFTGQESSSGPSAPLCTAPVCVRHAPRVSGGPAFPHKPKTLYGLPFLSPPRQIPCAPSAHISGKHPGNDSIVGILCPKAYIVRSPVPVISALISAQNVIFRPVFLLPYDDVPMAHFLQYIWRKMYPIRAPYSTLRIGTFRAILRKR